ncbi:MAG: trigger factor [bacterium]|nr:trigger factor [bacterium]
MSKLNNVKVSRDGKTWEVEVKAEIPADVLAHYRDAALKEMQKTAKLDGFRAGKVPQERIIEVYGEASVMRSAAEHAIQHELPELMAAEKVLIIESPKVTTDTPANGKPLAFTARAALAPEVELADYKAIAKEHMSGKAEVAVSDEEHKETMTHLKRERARIDKIEKGTEPQKAAEEARAMEEKDLPELDDDFVKALGYESAEVFSQKLRENIKSEKEARERDVRRAAILDELAEKSVIHYPAALKEYELDDMEARVKSDIERTGGTFEQYLAQIKKTREEMRGEWSEAADKRAKVRLVLSEIARKEKIEADTERLEKEIEQAKKHVPNADPEALRAHIAHALRNESVLKWLESLQT